MSHYRIDSPPIPPADPSKAGSGEELTQTAEEERAARVQRIQSQIEAGTYDDPEKLELALERLLDHLGDA